MLPPGLSNPEGFVVSLWDIRTRVEALPRPIESASRGLHDWPDYTTGAIKDMEKRVVFKGFAYFYI
jgi:hypothetical protein